MSYTPGLARLFDVYRSESQDTEGNGISREKWTLVLGSQAGPLCKCESVLELLKVTFDAVVSTSSDVCSEVVQNYLSLYIS